MFIRRTLKYGISFVSAVLLATGITGSAYAGSIYLTGHDVLLHSGQNSYDAVILDFLRGAGTGDEIAKADYDISVVGTTGVGFARFSGQASNIVGANGSAISLTGSLAGFGGATFYDAQTANWTTVLSADALVILSFTGCGGCSLTSAGSAAVNAQSAAIATAFNADMDIWGLSGDGLSTYYDFLPPGATSTGPSISGSSGFTATADGAALGITSSMINGFPTHNRFDAFDPDFTVFETRLISGIDEKISIGIRDATITDGDIGDGDMDVPEPVSLALFGIGLGGIGFLMRRRRKAA